jgi:hypothetical protein
MFYGDIMSRKILIYLLIFLGIDNRSYANVNDINRDFSSIFNKVQTEEGKKDMVPTYQGTNIPEAQINQNNINSETQRNLNSSEVGGFITNTFNTRPQYDIKQDTNLINSTIRITNEKDSVINKDYSDCGQVNIEYKICYKHTNNNNSCSAGIIINLNNYQTTDFLCKKYPLKYNKRCTKQLKLSCSTHKSDCITSGLELSSIGNDLDWTYNNNTLIIGKRGANNWSGTCLIVDRTIDFMVSNLELIEYFVFNRAIFDDYMSVTINDNLIYVGPYGGDKLEVYNSKVDYGTGKNSCELSTLWNQQNTVDMLQYIRQGKNTIKLRVIVSGTGQGSAEFLLSNKCCEEHIETWEEICE